MGYSFYISRSSVEVLRYFRALELLVFYLDAFLVVSSLIRCFDTFFESLILYQTKGATLGDQKKKDYFWVELTLYLIQISAAF